MAGSDSPLAGVFGAAQDLLGGIGSAVGGQATAKGDELAAQMYETAAAYERVLASDVAQEYPVVTAENWMRTSQTQRQVYQVSGQAAAVEGAGNIVTNSGSGFNIMSDTLAQGGMAVAQTRMQTLMDQMGMREKMTGIQIQESNDEFMAAQERAAAKSASEGGALGLLGGVLKGVGALFAL